MLEPEDRHYLSELLSPPAGFRLEKAVGTSYSLELPALLLAPMAMTKRSVEEAAFGEADGAEQSVEATPVSLVEAIRRTSERIALLCQRGRIKVPSAHSELFCFLESSILELDPDGGSFHPKFWLLHFTDGDSSRYRLVCTSRNLAYNRTWDFVVAMEGSAEVETGAEAAPLARFFEQTIGRAELDEGVFARREVLEAFAEELYEVAFRPPEPFDAAALCLHDWSNESHYDSLPKGDRAALISPFVSERALERLVSAVGDPGEPTVLVSRQESLDHLHHAAGGDWREQLGLDCRVVSVGEALRAGDDEDDLAGLHAKMYAVERGARTRWRFTSANLTHAGLGGANVEFGLDLEGPTGRVGIEQVLRIGEGREMGLGNLLEPYHPADEAPDADSVEAERRADAWRSFFAGAELVLEVEPTGDGDSYEVELRMTPRRPLPEAQAARIHVWPASLSREVDYRRVSTDTLGSSVTVDLGRVTTLNLTPFVAFEVRLDEPTSHTVSFVLGAAVCGLEHDRRELVLEHLIRNQDRFLQYLRYLLADVDSYWSTRTKSSHASSGDGGDRSRRRSVELPLMEELVTKCVDDPRKVYDIHSLIQSVRELEQADEIIPEAFVEDVWLPVLRAVNPELIDDY